MASNKVEGTYVPFSDAIKVTKLDSHHYKIHLSEAFCLGTVPNGGYAASCMLSAASIHLSPNNQPDTLTAHFEYPNRTAVGPAIVEIEDVKLGQQLSTLHLTLWQDGLLSQAPWITPSVSRRTILAYTTHTDLRNFSGISLPTGYEGTPAAALPPLPNFEELKAKGKDDAWEESITPQPSKFVRSLRNWHFYLPRHGALTPGVLDMWIGLASGERITQRALPYVADSFPFNLHLFLAAPELRQLLESQQAPGEKAETRAAREDLRKRDQQRGALWFPTVVMNLEMKTPLPEDGVDWLAVRITSKQIKDGRFDLDMLIRDAEGEIIALSHHVAMILSVQRNVGKRDFKGKAAL
ncbi:thioesterase family protein [Daldinia caldariorum]|uniref:thioesterase family protein n=1 Tax=Daldinia caldariorum TaxID=326644 RepID=UPI002007299B|nr:thioesterase family protein [Daldinia caldariorum]KAI1467233.1 thioesterase family protein [Daldinia caldariorum]